LKGNTKKKKKGKSKKNASSRSSIIAEHGLPPQVVTSLGPNASVDVIRDEQLPFSLMLLAVSLAYPKVVEEINGGRPFDLSFESGRRGRKIFGLPDEPAQEPEPLIAKAVPMMTSDMRLRIDSKEEGTYIIVCPFIVQFDNVVSPDFRNKFLDHLNFECLFTIDQKANTNSMRASVRRTGSKDNQVEGSEETPIMLKGTTPKTPAVLSSPEENVIQEMTQELANLLSGRSNEMAIKLIMEGKKSAVQQPEL
jgi:hypothetical protein